MPMAVTEGLKVVTNTLKVVVKDKRQDNGSV